MRFPRQFVLCSYPSDLRQRLLRLDMCQPGIVRFAVWGRLFLLSSQVNSGESCADAMSYEMVVRSAVGGNDRCGPNGTAWV